MPQTQALAKAEPKLELTHDGRGHDRAVARGADGKFTKKHTAAVRLSMTQMITFLQGRAQGKDKSRIEEMVNALYENILKASPEDLVGQAKAIELFEKMAFGSKAKDKAVDEANPMRGITVIITQPPLAYKEQTATPTRPSFVDAEVVSTNPPVEG
jgi:hypothetical protein